MCSIAVVQPIDVAAVRETRLGDCVEARLIAVGSAGTGVELGNLDGGGTQVMQRVICEEGQVGGFRESEISSEGSPGGGLIHVTRAGKSASARKGAWRMR